MTKRKPLGERILNRLNIPTKTDLAQSRSAAYKRGFKEGQETKRLRKRQSRWARRREAYDSDDARYDDPASGDIAGGGFGYKLSTGGVREPDITWEQNLETSWDLLQSKGIVKRCSNIKRDYIWGRDIAPQAADTALQPILDAFWEDNDMPSFGSEIVRQWADYGAQVIPAFVRDESDGRVRLGYFDPSLVDRVITHPENAREMWAVVIKAQQSTDKWVDSTNVQVYRIVRKAESVVVDEPVQSMLDSGEVVTESRERTIEATFIHPVTNEEEDVSGKLATAKQSPLAPWEETMLDEYKLKEYSGDCFLIRKNADSNQTLGRSDHVQVADFVDQKDAALFELGQREMLANLIFIDVKSDADPNTEAFQDRAAELRDYQPPPGSLNYHTITEEWNLNSPTLQQTSSVETVKAQTAEIMGGEGYPVHWYGRGDETNRATAQAQGDPTWRTLKHDQGQIQAFFLKILNFVRDQAIIAGKYTPDENADTTIDLPMPEMIAKDTMAVAGALSSVISAMSLAVNDGAATKDAYIEVVSKIVSEMGVNMDVDELKDDAANEQQGKLLGGQGDGVAALFNRKSWESVHGALGDEEK